MKRKLLCLLLCISMVLPNVPMAVLADEAGACEHVGVSEDGTVSGNGVCEVCSDKEVKESGQTAEEELFENIQKEQSLSDADLTKEEENNSIVNLNVKTEGELGEEVSATTVSENDFETKEKSVSSNNLIAVDDENDGVINIRVEFTHKGFGNIEDIVPKSTRVRRSIRGGNTWDDSTNKFYGQLDQDSKAAYDALKTFYSNGVTADVMPITINKEISVVDGNPMSDVNKKAIQDEISNIVNYGFLALIHDEPELSWLMSVSFGCQFTLSGEPQGANQYKWTPTDIQFSLGEGDNKVYTRNELDGAIAVAKASIDNIIATGEGSGSYKTLKAIHDYICNNVAYASGDISLDKYQTAHSALIGDHNTVCAGYAKSFKILCDEYGIPCVLVSGQATGSSQTPENHMWNYVKIGGNWYAVDCTWDDQTEKASAKIFYDYFLVGSSTTATNFGGSSFSTSHIPSGRFSDGVSQDFAYPTLSNASYSESTDATAPETVYVSTSGLDSASGEEASPVKTLEKALEKVKEGGTIVIKDSYASAYADVGNDKPFIINKEVTIQGGTFDNSHAGIILGADVTFKEINIGLNNAVRNVIIANGHSLTLDNVESIGTYGINLFCGNITEKQDTYTVPTEGTDGKIILKGNNKLKNGNGKGGHIYAGNFSDLGTTKDGQNPTQVSTFTGDATIQIEQGASGSIGDIFVYGAREDRDSVDYDTDMITGSGIEENYKVAGNVKIYLSDSLVKKVSGASDKVAHVIYNSNSLIEGITFSNIDILEVNGNLKPASLDRGVSIILNSGARLDMTGLPSGVPEIKNFQGSLVQNTPGIIILDQNHDEDSAPPDTMEISGDISGYTVLCTDYPTIQDNSTSGIVTTGHSYIIGNSASDGSEFIFNPYFTQKNIILNYADGAWTAQEEGEQQVEKPTIFSIEAVYKNLTRSKTEINQQGVSIPISATFASDDSLFSDVPLNISVSYGSQSSTAREESGSYIVSTCNMEFYVTGDDDKIFLGKNGGDIAARQYVITIAVETVSGSKTETITLTVTDDTQTPVPDAEFNPELPVNGWYRGLKLHAPDGYEIATTENGDYHSFIDIPNGEYTDYKYWLKNNTDGKKNKKTIASLRVDDESPVITKQQVTDTAPTTAKINVTATDQVSGLTAESYSLGIASAGGSANPIIGTFQGTKDGGYFEISEMTVNETYVFNLIIRDAAGNETVEEVTIVAGKYNLSAGQLTVNSNITYLYDSTEQKPGADQLVLTVNGQRVTLNNTDYTYSYSNNTNAGSNARVTVTAKDTNSTYVGSVTGTFTIDKRPLTITPKAQTIRSGNQIQTGVSQVEINNKVSGHLLEVITLTQDNTNKKIKASNAVIKDTLQTDVTSNYQITYNEGNLTIVDPVITIQGKNNIVYDGNPLVVGASGTQNDVTYTLKECSTPVIKWYKADTGGIKGEEFTGTPKDAGNYIVEISATVDNNLGTVTTEKQVTIQKVPLTATVSNKTLTYGDMFSQPGNTVTYSGFVGSDSAETVITGGTPQFSTNYVQYQNKGTYNITADLSAISAVNYEIKVVPGTLTVTPRQATLSWNNYENRIYGDGKSVTATISNLVNNDKVTVAVSGADATEVGTHTATATGLMGEKAANYTLSTGTTQNYIIAKATAPTNVTAQRNMKWSKGGTETFAVTDFSLPANVNNPKITKVTKNMGETADDQGIFINNSQVVNGQVSLSLIKPSIYKEGQKGVFDVTITSDTHEDITAKLILNIIDREVVDSNLTLSVANITYGQLPAPKGSFSGSKATNVTEVYKYSKDGTAYQELDSLKNTSGFLPAGDYSVQYSYTDDEQIGTKTAAFRVEKKELNIRFDVETVTKEYDGTTSVPSDKLPTLIIKEAVGSEQPKLVNTGVQFTYHSIQAGEGKTIQVTGLSLDTSESVNDNYTVQSTVSSVGAIITPKKATVLPKTAYTKQYGEKDPVLEYKVTGLIGQDTLEGVLKRAAGENVGSYSYDISGLKNQNYKVELDASSSKFDITKAEAQLTLEADLAAQKAGGKVTLTASAKSKKELEVSGAAQPTAAELTGVSFTEKTAGVFEGVYTIPENAKAGDKIIITVTLKDANYKEVAAKTVIQVIEEELQALPVPQEKPEAEGDKKPSYKLAMEQGISKVPDGLKKLGHLDTVEEIRDALKLEIKKLHWEITDATSAIYDVTLWYHPGDDDSVWQKADKNHWPKSGKITVVLPYPEGTGKNTHNFNVTHMFTVEMNNNKPGTFEYPQVTKTDQGISFQVSGLSPITLGWTRIQEAPAPNPGSGNSTGGSSDSSEDSSSATTTTVIKRQEVKKEEAKATDTTAVAVAKEPGKQKNTKVTVKKEEKEVADNNVVSEKPEATQQTEDAVKEITEEVQEIEGIEEASEVPQDTTQKVQEETKSSSVLWIAAIVALAAAGVVSFILWKNKKNEEG